MNSTPGTGATAPEFSVSDVEGNAVSLKKYRGENPVLLVLNRGFK
jgi:peroxiredoxin